MNEQIYLENLLKIIFENIFFFLIGEHRHFFSAGSKYTECGESRESVGHSVVSNSLQFHGL